MRSFFEEYESGRAFARARESAANRVLSRSYGVLRDSAVRVARIGLSKWKPSGGSALSNGAYAVTSARRAVKDGGGAVAVSSGLSSVRDTVEDGIRGVNVFMGIEEEDNGVREYIEDVHYGRTFDERQREYGNRFLFDVCVMLAAGRFLGMTDKDIVDGVYSGFENPYAKGGILSSARLSGFSFIVPSYGIGRVRAGATALLNNASDTLALGWETIRMDYERASGAVGYYVFRGSSYPCQLCDDEKGWLHSMDDPGVPVHNHCRCFMVYVHSIT